MKVGLTGELAKRLFDPKSPHGKVFTADKVPIGRPMTWYKVILLNFSVFLFFKILMNLNSMRPDHFPGSFGYRTSGGRLTRHGQGARLGEWKQHWALLASTDS